MAESAGNSPTDTARERGADKARRGGPRTASARAGGASARSSARSSSGRSSSGRSSSGRLRPPVKRSTSSNARLLAPLALVICALVVLVVITGSGSDNGAVGPPAASSSQSAKSSAGDAASGTASGAATGNQVTPKHSSYKVKPGDSFAAIAESTGVDVDTLATLNPDVDPRALQPGQKLKLK